MLKCIKKMQYQKLLHFYKYYLVKDYFLPFAASVSAWRNARVITTEATG